MNSFTIRDIENMCGIKAHTLRVWEQRYQFFLPKRKPGNHRLYDNEGLKHMLRVALLYRNGYKISAIAKLSETEICQRALSFSPTGNPMDVYVNQLTEASLDFDGERFEGILDDLILKLGFEHTIREVAYPFLRRVGLLWLTGNVIPAQEHFASGGISRKIQVEIDRLVKTGHNNPGRSARSVLLFTPPGEFHEIPLLFMRYLMMREGTATIYFGVNICLEELEYYCRQQPVTHLYFHLITKLLRVEPKQYIHSLIKLFPDKQIVMSGSLSDEVRTDLPHFRALPDEVGMRAFAMEE